MLHREGKIEIMSYIEIALLFILTVGPLDPVYKIIIYIFLMLYNVRYVPEFRYLSIAQGILLLSMLIPMLLDIGNVDATTPYSKAGFAYFMPFLFCIFLTRKYEKKDFLCLTESVAFLASLISLLGFSLVLFAPNIIFQFPSFLFYGRKIYSILFFGAIRDYSGGLLLRNCGIAYEPGAFQFVCNLGLALYTAGFNKSQLKLKNIARYLIYITGVLSTKSTMGLLILAILMCFMVVRNRKSILLLVAILILFSGIITQTVSEQSRKMETGNIESRFGNSIYVIENYGSHFFGLGSTGYDKIYRTDHNIGSWDTYTNLYLRFGMPFLLVFLFMSYKAIRMDKALGIVVTLTLLTEALVGPITITLFYYALEDGKEFISENTMDM